MAVEFTGPHICPKCEATNIGTNYCPLCEPEKIPKIVGKLDSSLDRIVVELEAIEALKQASKSRSMIYQCEAKEQLALSIGLWFDSFYYLPYEQWQDIYRYFKNNC